MDNIAEKYRGIHPGAVIDRELKKRKLAQRPFALSILEHPQSLNAITKGKRGMNTALALKIEKALDLEEGTLMILQVYYDIKIEKQKHSISAHPDFSIIRRPLFWDTDMDQIDWEKHYKYVIRRIFERGNDEEKMEILRFYGEKRINEVTGSPFISGNSIPVMQHLKHG
jgi:plasmid maintenance system antidote protein VapI